MAGRTKLCKSCGEANFTRRLTCTKCGADFVIAPRVPAPVEAQPPLPETPVNFKAVLELQSQINDLRSTILYLENRILHKQLAIAELMLSQ